MKHLRENIITGKPWGYPPNLLLERGGLHRLEVVAARVTQSADEYYGTTHDSERVSA